MSDHKDWHAVDEDDLHTTSEEDEGHHDFNLVGDSEVDSEAEHTQGSESRFDSEGDDSSVKSSEASNGVSDSEDVSENESDDVITPRNSEAVSNLETAFANSEIQEDNTPIDFDADEDLVEAGTQQDRWQMTNAYMRDMQQAFRDRPAVKVQGNERYMKILLVGEHGLGKEAFIKNVFAPYCADNDLPANVCEVNTKLKDFRAQPNNFCTEVVIDVDEGRTKIHYHMQDTPGTHQDSLPVILEYVRNQNQKYMSMEEDSRRNVPLGSLPDPRVDVALYFLSPFFLKPQDIIAMTKLAQFVPVIPLIAKADALTTAELNKYRNEIKEQLAIAEENARHPIMHTFGEDQLRQAGAVRGLPPFAIITSSEIDSEVGRHWFTRTFPWGKCEVMSSNHSDLPALKSLLFEQCFESIKAATESRFYTARESFLTDRALSKAMSSRELPPVPTSRPRAALAQTTAAVQASLPKPKPSKASKPEKSGWGWKWTALTAAVLLHVLLFTYYSRGLSDMKSVVDTYKAESAAEKQEIQEMLREKLYAIEQMPDGGRGRITAFKGVRQYFSMVPASIKAASIYSARAVSQSTRSATQAIALSLSSQTTYIGRQLQNGYIHTHQSTKQSLAALPNITQNAATSFGQSVKSGHGAAYRLLASQASRSARYTGSSVQTAWRVVSSQVASQASRLSQKSANIFCSMGCSLRHQFKAAGRAISFGFKHAGLGAEKRLKNCGKGINFTVQRSGYAVAQGFKAASSRIADSSQSLASKSLQRSSRFFSDCGSKIARASKGIGSGVKCASRRWAKQVTKFDRAVVHSLGKGLNTTGKAFKFGALKTQYAIQDFASSTVQKTKSMWCTRNKMGAFTSWYHKNSHSIMRALRRAAIANVLQ